MILFLCKLLSRSHLSVQHQPAWSWVGVSCQQVSAQHFSLQWAQQPGGVAESCPAGWTVSKPHSGTGQQRTIEGSFSSACVKVTFRMRTARFAFFVSQIKKGVVVKGGRFRPNRVALRTLSGPVLLHRSSVNRSERALKFSCSRCLLSWFVLHLMNCFIGEKRSFPVAGWPFSVRWSPTGTFSSETPPWFIHLPCCCLRTVTSQR